MKNIFVKVGKSATIALVALALFTGFAGSAKAFSLDDFMTVVKAIKAETGTITAQQASALAAMYSSSASSSASMQQSSAVSNSSAAAASSSTSSSAAVQQTAVMAAQPAAAVQTVSPVMPIQAVSTAPVFANTAAPVVSVSAAAAPVLKTAGQGDTGSNVLAIQTILAAKGYLAASPNGIYGPATAVAVKAFQKANGLESVGSIGPKTLKVLADIGVQQGTLIKGSGAADVSSASFLVSANFAAYGDQTVAVNTTHYKIGSYTVKNMSASESAKVTSLLFGFTIGGSATVDQLHNIAAYTGATQIGTTVPSVGAASTVSIPASITLAPMASTMIDLYADVGTAAVGSGWRSNMLAFGTGLTTLAAYNSGSSVSGQVVYIGTPSVSPCSITAFYALPSTVASGATTTVYYTSTGCTTMTLTGTPMLGGTSSISVGTNGSYSGIGPLYSSSTYVLTASGATGPSVSQSVTVSVSSSTSEGLVVSKNSAYPNTTVSANTTHVKIGSFIVTNTASEPISINDMTLDVGAGSFGITNLSNLYLYVNSTLLAGPAAPTYWTGGYHVGWGTGTLIPVGSYATVEAYADIGAASSGTTKTSLALVHGTGASTSSIYTASPVVLGQTINVSNACLISVALDAASSTPSQTIAVGSSAGLTGGSHADILFTTPVTALLKGLKFSVVPSNSAVAVNVGSGWVPFVSGIADMDFGSLSTMLYGGGANGISAYFSYPGVGITGVPSGTTSTVKLTGIKFITGGVTSTCDVSVTAPTMTLVQGLSSPSLPTR